MVALVPSAIWKDTPRQLLNSDFNYASLFNEQNQDLLNQGEFVKNQLTTLSSILNDIETQTNVLSGLNAEITNLRSQLSLSNLTIENDSISSRLTATNTDFNTISTARTNAENATLAAENKLSDLTLDTKVQRLNPLLTELAQLSKVNDRNLTVAANGAYNWSLYAGVRIRPQVALLMENQASGVNGGAGTVNTWVKRNLNTIKYLNIDGANLSNQIVSLPAGNYIALGFSLSAGVGFARSRLQRSTGTLGLGGSTNGITDGGTAGRITNTTTPLYTAFTLTSPADISYEFINTNNPSALPGAAQGRATGLDTENYAQLMIISANPPI